MLLGLNTTHIYLIAFWFQLVVRAKQHLNIDCRQLTMCDLIMVNTLDDKIPVTYQLFF